MKWDYWIDSISNTGSEHEHRDSLAELGMGSRRSMADGWQQDFYAVQTAKIRVAPSDLWFNDQPELFGYAEDET
jgi:hypothetical protein